jgi:hypothetical protein
MFVEQLVGCCWNERSDAVECASSLGRRMHRPMTALQETPSVRVVAAGLQKRMMI